MIEHHLQKEILHALVIRPTARFADLKPKEVDGNLFTYHLQQLIKQKYVQKNEDGSYSLTALGKATGINIKLSAKDLSQQAHAILLLKVTDAEGAWLLRRRLAHPTYGKTGFIHGEPMANEDVAQTAAKIFERRTGLSGKFTAVGSGYIRIFQSNELESFTQFTLLSAIIEHAEPQAHDETGENMWIAQPDFTADDMLVSMPDLATQLSQADGQLFFCDLTYRL